MIALKDLRPAVLSGGVSFLFFIILGSLSPLLAYEVISVEHGGNVSGTIKVKGAVSSGRLINVTKNSEVCGQTVQDESMVVNSKNNGLKNVMVLIESINKGKRYTAGNLMVNNKKCRFEFHVLGGMAGDSFTIKNSDPILHNTHLHNQEKFSVVNVAMPPGGRIIQRSVGDNRGLIEMKCDVHKFMRGWMNIMGNPYFAVTDDDGNFNISDIPPGNYKLKFWHETLSIAEKGVSVLPDKTAHLSVEASLE